MQSEGKATMEIDIMSVFKKIIANWRTLVRFEIVGVIMGLVVAFGNYKLYSSVAILAPEFGSGSSGLSGNLSDLASSFGVDLSGSKSVDAIYPELYPDIFASTDFLQSLYDVPVRLEDDEKVRTYREHIVKDFKNPFWTYPMTALKKLLKSKKQQGGGVKDPFVCSRDEWELINSLRSLLLCDVDKKSNVITITVIDQDPLVAAIMADTIKNRLQKYITDYRTSKVRVDVEHYRELVKKQWNEYQSAVDAYSQFSDSHMNAVLASATSKKTDLENDMQLKYNLYSQVLGQLKMSEAKLQEKTPAFTVIQRPVTNPKPVSMPKIVVLILWLVVFAMADFAWVLFIREQYSRYKSGKMLDE